MPARRGPLPPATPATCAVGPSCRGHDRSIGGHALCAARLRRSHRGVMDLCHADPQTLAAFWKPFDVVLSTSDVHRSTLALIDRRGYIRTYFLGAPDVGGTLPAPLDTQ